MYFENPTIKYIMFSSMLKEYVNLRREAILTSNLPRFGLIIWTASKGYLCTKTSLSVQPTWRWHIYCKSIQPTFTQIPNPIHSSSGKKVVLEAGVTRMQTLLSRETNRGTTDHSMHKFHTVEEASTKMRREKVPVWETRQLFLHSWWQFFCLHWLSLTIAFCINRLAIPRLGYYSIHKQN